MMFRGQPRAWPLLPSIARLTQQVNDYANWNIFQLDLLERFVRFASPFLERAPKNSVEWLVHAQHYGVPTRLLDWTTNPLKALFWAVENRSVENVDGVVWAFTPSYWRQDILRPTELDEDGLTAFLPMHLNERVVAQEGCFVSFPLSLDCNPMRAMEEPRAYRKGIGSLRRFDVPATAKPRLRRELSLLGVSHRFLLPGLAGVARQITEDIT